MVDVNARRHTRSVQQGERFSGEDPTGKIMLYGTLAQYLGRVNLGGLTVPPADNFYALRSNAQKTLQRFFYEDMDLQDPEVSANLTAAFAGHAWSAKRMGDSYDHPRQRLTAGLMTGIDIVTRTAATLAREQNYGTTVTQDGLYRSSRVPVKLAMGHLYDLSSNIEELFEPYPPLESSTLRYGTFSLDHESGLSLKPKLIEVDVPERTEHGPHIGCPITLVKDYTENMHRIIVNAALESGLLTAD
jgi:hypothetical protein